jgi:copper chaperone
MMATKTYLIPNISCAHCIMHITQRLNEIEGVENVEGDVTSKEVTVEFSEPASDEAIIAALEEINYPPRR